MKIADYFNEDIPNAPSDPNNFEDHLTEEEKQELIRKLEKDLLDNN